MVLSFRAQMHGHLQRNNSPDIPNFLKSCNTADRTFKYCSPKLLEFGILSQSDVDSLTSMRQRRNHFAHSGYDETFELTVAQIEDDVKFMHAITGKVENWAQVIAERREDGSTPFTVSPAIFVLYLHVATDLARSKLSIPPAP